MRTDISMSTGPGKTHPRVPRVLTCAHTRPLCGVTSGKLHPGFGPLDIAEGLPDWRESLGGLHDGWELVWEGGLGALGLFSLEERRLWGKAAVGGSQKG